MIVRCINVVGDGFRDVLDPTQGGRVRDGCERFHVAALLRPDGELPALELELLEAHAARCRECRAYAAEIGQITSCIRATPPLCWSDALRAPPGPSDARIPGVRKPI